MNAYRVVSVHRDRCPSSADQFRISTICTGKSAIACSTWTTNEILAGLQTGRQLLRPVGRDWETRRSLLHTLPRLQCGLCIAIGQ